MCAGAERTPRLTHPGQATPLVTNHAPVIIVYVSSIAGPVRLGALLRGYAAAYGRLVTAMQEPDELAAFAPLFERSTGR